MIQWDLIDQVFLDMDGTLLDLRFDNHFWLEHVPRRYAQAKGLSDAQAARELRRRYRSIEGTLDWYCVDHWSQELGLDIALLKEEVDHLIAVHPHVLDFLHWLRVLGKQSVLVTNAHQKSLALKLRKTKLGGYLDKVVCAHDLGLPKEHPEFWQRLQPMIPFDRKRTLFVDDNPAVLSSARVYGMRWLLQVLAPDTQGPLGTATDFPAIENFSQIMPER